MPFDSQCLLGAKMIKMSEAKWSRSADERALNVAFISAVSEGWRDATTQRLAWGTETYVDLNGNRLIEKQIHRKAYI